MVQPEHLHPPCWNCVDGDFSRDWNQLSFPGHQQSTKQSTLISHFLCILRMPESSGAASVVVREDGCEIENKGERGDLDVNNISEPLIL